jgi:hypothetical protein
VETELTCNFQPTLALDCETIPNQEQHMNNVNKKLTHKPVKESEGIRATVYLPDQEAKIFSD